MNASPMQPLRVDGRGSCAIVLGRSGDSGFALTEIQQAYWVGEQGELPLSTPACLYRCYFTPRLDVPRLGLALRALARKHASLRLRILPEGLQQVCEPPERIHVPVFDATHLDADGIQLRLREREREVESMLPPIDQGPQFACSVDRCDNGFYVHLRVRLVALDGQSIRIFFADLAAAYRDPDSIAASPEMRFEDFVRARREARQSATHQRAEDYWAGRLAALPPAPELPVRRREEIPSRSRFERMQITLGDQEIAELQ
ncbi:MAG TPA: condensation domain-containing protein, partial [Burkholderiaceae bacterium]|nr:condensation domain-containing protein [Burkholderiaceae bacterium]